MLASKEVNASTGEQGPKHGYNYQQIGKYSLFTPRFYRLQAFFM